MDKYMDVKKSRYNIFVPQENGKYIVFNSLSGAIGIFESDTMERFSSNTLTNEEMNILIRKGIFVSAATNELDIINCDRVNGIFSHNRSFRIWPTSACNARCYYCFEKGISPASMTEETADSLIDFICKLTNEEDTVSIEWFGGEPLMNTGIIDYISKRISYILGKKSIPWRASMISNGSLLTLDIVRKMIKLWNVERIQITLDGYGEEYNRAKSYLNPILFNFEKVIHNIRLLLDNGIHVSIRMNYDTVNYKTLKKLISFLAREFSHEPNISYYVYPIWNALGDCKNGFTTTTEADLQLIDLFEDLVTSGMASAGNLARLQYRKRQCSSCGINNYSVLPNGDILKCSEAFNCVVGNVFSGIADEVAVAKWTDPGLDDECICCSYLPLCQGGCRASRVTNMPRCMAFKKIIPELLKWYVVHAGKQQKPSMNGDGNKVNGVR